MSSVATSELKAAIVGTGFMASVHSEALARIGVEVLGVVGSSPERSARAAAARGLRAAYGSLEELLEDERVDVVHITSPNEAHYEQALRALRACKHVICEKPLAISSEQSLELVREAERSGNVHAVNFMTRFYPQCQEARARVSAGAVGELRLVTGDYLQDWLSSEDDWNWRIDSSLGGPLRTIGDLGSHWLDLVSFISGKRVEAVMADLTTAIPVRQRPADTRRHSSADADPDERRVPWVVDTEDLATVLLRFEGGGRGAVTFSQVSPGRKNHLVFELSGAGESMSWSSERPEELWVGRRKEPNQVLVRDPALMSDPAAAGDYPAGHAQGFSDAFKSLHRTIYTAIARGERLERPDYPTFADGHEQVLVAEAIARSSEAGRWVPVRAGREAFSLQANTTTREQP